MILFISRFGFEGWIWVLIASVLDLCIRLTPFGVPENPGHFLAIDGAIGAKGVPG